MWPWRAPAFIWKPDYNLLESSFEVMVVNARHIKAVPGRKTDLNDAEWIADLLQHGLLKASFIPNQDLRELIRYRKSLVQIRSGEVSRTHKFLLLTRVLDHIDSLQEGIAACEREIAERM